MDDKKYSEAWGSLAAMTSGNRGNQTIPRFQRSVRRGRGETEAEVQEEEDPLTRGHPGFSAATLVEVPAMVSILQQ